MTKTGLGFGILVIVICLIFGISIPPVLQETLQLNGLG
jgi:hypothetical protein